MEWIKSACVFLWEVLKRSFFMLSLLIEDVRAPAEWPWVGDHFSQSVRDWQMSSVVAAILIGIVVAWASIHTYHEERSRRMQAETESKKGENLEARVNWLELQISPVPPVNLSQDHQPGPVITGRDDPRWWDVKG